MRQTAIALLLLTAAAPAQTVVSPGQLTRLLRDFQSQPGDAPLRCEVTPLPPVLNFAFRFEAGYTFHVPQTQYPGPVRGWSELTTITPEGGNLRPVVFVARQQFAEVTKSDLNFEIHGVYFLGVGTYSVESAIRDDRNRVCRKQWHIAVHSSHGDGPAQSALPPYAIRPFSASSYTDTRHIDDAAPIRVSVLVNAAAFSARRTSLRPIDRLVLVNALTAMLEHLPTASVHLVVFSLEQQREIYRSDDFSLSAMAKVAEAMAALDLAKVDVRLLQKPLGHVDFLADLINRELQAPTPLDAVVFLGPPSRYENKIPSDALKKPSAGYPHFFYIQYQGPRRTPMPPPSPDPQPLPGLGGRGSNVSSLGGSADSSSSDDIPPPPRIPPPSSGGSNNGSGGTNSGSNSGSNNGNNSGGTTNGSSSSSSGSGSSGRAGSGSSVGGSGGLGGIGSGSGGRAGRNLPPPAFPGPQQEVRETDIIHTAVSRLKGRTLAIHTPADLARAIRTIEQKR